MFARRSKFFDERVSDSESPPHEKDGILSDTG